MTCHLQTITVVLLHCASLVHHHHHHNHHTYPSSSSAPYFSISHNLIFGTWLFPHRVLQLRFAASSRRHHYHHFYQCHHFYQYHHCHHLGLSTYYVRRGGGEGVLQMLTIGDDLDAFSVQCTWPSLHLFHTATPKESDTKPNNKSDYATRKYMTLAARHLVSLRQTQTFMFAHL